VAVLALRWRLGRIAVPEIVALEGTPMRPLQGLAQIVDRAEHLALSSPSPLPVPMDVGRAAVRLIRSRLDALRIGPHDRETVRIRRLLLELARRAGWERNAELIAQMDRVLDRLSSGLPVGAVAGLRAVLQQAPTSRSLRRWLKGQPPGLRGEPMVAIETILCGDGTRES